MESLVKLNLFNGCYKGKRVLITGHTGFKGSWLALWLRELGAIVQGYAKAPPSDPSHFDLLKLDIKSEIADVRDLERLKKVFNEFKPEIVFHLAAQPLVRLSYREPLETFESNIMGALNVYEACRFCDSVRAIVSITTDKVYENKEWIWGYREDDILGGKDPYSASKAAVEIVTSSYRNSFFNLDKYKVDHNILLATTRAGNVIGGGDWAADRLIPDIMRAASRSEPVKIRNPKSTRPWEHVLEPLSGYLMLGERLLRGEKDFATSFNFGPMMVDDAPVELVAQILKKFWNKVEYKVEMPKENFHEANLLKLDFTRATQMLSWKPVWHVETTLEKTVMWYKNFYEAKQVKSIEDLQCYIEDAKKLKLVWTSEK